MSEQDTSTAPEPTTPLEAAITAAAGDDPDGAVNVMIHRHGDAYYAIAEGRTGHLGRGSTADDALNDLRASLECAQ